MAPPSHFKRTAERSSKQMFEMMVIDGAVVIAFANRKGGVGKTTGTAMIATMLSMLGFRVLVIDNDPQANVTSSLGYVGYKGKNLYDVLLDRATLQECIVKTAIDPETNQYFDPQKSEKEHHSGPYLVPNTLEADNADFDLKSKVPLWIYQMRTALQSVSQKFDYILIDCNPGLGTLTLNALAAAHHIIIPVLPERMVAEGFSDLLGIIATTRRKFNPSLQVTGVFFSMVERWQAHREVKEELRKPQVRKDMVQVFGEDYPPLHIFDAEIKHNAELAKSTNKRSLLVLTSP